MTGVCFKNQKYPKFSQIINNKIAEMVVFSQTGKKKKKNIRRGKWKAANKRRNWQTTPHETDRKQIRDQVVPGDELCFLPLAAAAAAALRFLGPEGISLASSSIEMRRWSPKRLSQIETTAISKSARNPMPQELTKFHQQNAANTDLLPSLLPCSSISFPPCLSFVPSLHHSEPQIFRIWSYRT